VSLLETYRGRGGEFALPPTADTKPDLGLVGRSGSEVFCTSFGKVALADCELKLSIG
jgi:hypothetical protein